VSIVWGVDPGTTRVGISVFHVDKDEKSLLNIMLIDLTEEDVEGRLGAIAKTTSFFADLYPPDIVGMEKLVWGRNVTTALSVAEARGVMKYIFSLYNASIVECLPKVVKSAVGAYMFGKGKDAVREAVVQVFSDNIRATGVPWYAIIDDVIDAVAIALAVIEGDC